MSPWMVYGIEVDDRLEYIGITSNAALRKREHGSTRFWGKTFRMVTLKRVQTKPAALTAERDLITKHQPPMNIQHRGLGRSSTVSVNIVRPDGAGGMVAATMRLRPGMMHPDAARVIWFSGAHTTNAEAILDMPGWSVNRAIRTFGVRKPGEPDDAW
jgi:predicted GIY-YIG superfamily endonuclease